MENRFLNVSIMQHTITADLDTNLRVIEESVENLMMGYVRPELIVGVEFGNRSCVQTWFRSYSTVWWCRLPS